MNVPSTSLIRFRAAVLQRAFKLLYGRLVLLHEPLGRLVFGPAWARRRLELLDHLRPGELAVDVGAGSGLLVAEARKRTHSFVGVEPSRTMRAAAANAGAPVAPGCSWDLPFPDRSVNIITSTYPGPWILEARTIVEFQRVLATEGRLIVLVGGTVERGPRSSFRRAILSLAYGRSRSDGRALQPSETNELEIEVVQREDQWGTAYMWIGSVRRA